MKLCRIAAGALVAAAFASGCRSNGFGTLNRPLAATPAPSLDVDQLVARHNREARLIRTYQGTPTVSTKNKSGRKNVFLGVAHGSLYIEPPRNFRLVLKAVGKEVVDVGSNEDRLWLWSDGLGDGKTVFTCSYDESGAVPLSGLYQPDWIMEALGLEALPEPGTDGVTVRRENNGADYVLEQRRTGGDGKVVIKETVLSGLDGRVVEHRLFQLDSNNKKIPVASAKIVKFDKHEVKTPGEEAEAATVELPALVEVHWPAEGVDLEVKLDGVQLNRAIAMRDKKFSVPEARGKTEDLRKALGLAAEPGGTSIRETRPEPPSGVRLSEPIPAASREPKLPALAAAPPVRAVAIRSSEPEPLVNADLPRGPSDPETGEVRTEWRGAQGQPVRR